MLSNNNVCSWKASKSVDERRHCTVPCPRARSYRKACQVSVMAFPANQINWRLNRRRHRSKRLIRMSEIIEALQAAGGLWSSVGKMEDALVILLTPARKVDAMKVQIRFRKKVLCLVADRNMFSFSLNKKKLTVDELKFNLRKLINTVSPVSSGSRGLTDSEDEDQSMERDTRNPPVSAQPPRHPVEHNATAQAI